MSDKQLTFEEVNTHFENADLSIFEKGGKHNFSATDVVSNPNGVLENVCRIYRIVRPFLALVSNIPLIPASWKNAIKTFVGLMDQLCPG
jgi:hypothetical protein